MATKENNKSGVVVSGGDKADVLSNYGGKVTISALKGNDDISNYGGNNVSINAGAGNDSVSNWGNQVTILGGAGNDSIENYGDKVTVTSGTGNDRIYNEGVNVLFKYSSGNDYIEGFNTTSTLQIASGTINSVLSTNGYNYYLTVGDNRVTLFGGAKVDKLNIVDAKGKAIKYNVNKRILGTKGVDYFTNYLDSAKIICGRGNDSIWNYGSKATLLGEGGNDQIDNIWGNSVLIDGGAGNDKIWSDGSNVTIDGGAGDDYIHQNNGSNILFKYSGGNDTIYGFDETSTLQIMSGKLNPVITSDGTDYLLTVGKNKIKLSKSNGDRLEKINIVNSKGKAISYRVKTNITGTRVRDNLNNYADNAVILGDAGNDNINSSGNNISIDAGAGNDFINIRDNKTWNEETKQYDYTYSKKVTVTAGAGNDTIWNYGSNVIILGGAGNDSIDNRGTYVTIDGGAGNDTIVNRYDNVSIDGGAGNDLISLSSYAENNLLVYKTGDGNDIIEGFEKNDSIKIIGTSKFTGTVNENDVILTIGTGTITLKDAVKKKITILNSKDKLLAENIYLNDGSIVSPSVTLKADVTSFDMGSYTSKVDASKTSAGVRIYSNSYRNDDLLILGGAGNDTLNGESGSDRILGGTGNDSLYGGYGNDTLDGGAGADTLNGGVGDDSLLGGAGNDSLYGGYDSDTLWGGAGNDTLTGGHSNNVFVYKPNEGTDTITDYYYSNYSCDILQILKADGSEGGTFTDSNFSGNKLTLMISGGGSVILEGVNANDKFNINGTVYSISGAKLKS